MARVRMRYNFDLIRSYTRIPETERVILGKARDIDASLMSAGVKTRVDSAVGRKRVRAAVIAGYEDGATAEGTRRSLLLALDAAHDPSE